MNLGHNNYVLIFFITLVRVFHSKVGFPVLWDLLLKRNIEGYFPLENKWVVHDLLRYACINGLQLRLPLHFNIILIFKFLSTSSTFFISTTSIFQNLLKIMLEVFDTCTRNTLRDGYLDKITTRRRLSFNLTLGIKFWVGKMYFQTLLQYFWMKGVVIKLDVCQNLYGAFLFLVLYKSKSVGKDRRHKYVCNYRYLLFVIYLIWHN